MTLSLLCRGSILLPHRLGLHRPGSDPGFSWVLWPPRRAQHPARGSSAAAGWSKLTFHAFALTISTVTQTTTGFNAALHLFNPS